MYLHSDLIKIKDTNLKYTNYRSMINQKLCYRQTQIKWRSKTKVLRANMENLLDENRTIKFILDKKQNGGTNNEHAKNQYTDVFFLTPTFDISQSSVYFVIPTCDTLQSTV